MAFWWSLTVITNGLPVVMYLFGLVILFIFRVKILAKKNTRHSFVIAVIQLPSRTMYDSSSCDPALGAVRGGKKLGHG